MALYVHFSLVKEQHLAGFSEYWERWSLFLAYSFVSVVYFQYSNLYKSQHAVNKKGTQLVIFKSIGVLTVGFIFLQFLLHDFKIESRGFYIEFFLICIVAFIGLRKYALKPFSGSPFFRDKVIIIGAGKKGRDLLKTLNQNIQLYDVMGFLDDKLTGSIVGGVKVLGKISDLENLKKEQEIDYVILGIDKIERKRFFEIFDFLNQSKIDFFISSKYLKELNERLDIDVHDQLGMIKFCVSAENKAIRYMKRFFDFALSSISLILLSPLFMFLAFCIKFTSKGPVIYKQLRIGKDGKTFEFYKFRSMTVGSDQDQNRKEKIQDFIRGGELSGDSTKLVNESRVTSIGQVIRKHSLDELPQLFNVIKGDMSMVGPRPCIVPEWEVYEDWQKMRYDGLPGCTGVWQVNGRSEVSFEDTVLMDIFYNRNFTVWMDFHLLLKTIPVVLTGRGGK